MKKEELKKILKPLIKECIKEVMFEEGTLSTIISEVLKGTGQNQLMKEQVRPRTETINEEKLHEKRRQKHQEKRKKLLDAIGNSYNGVDLFEGTSPMTVSNESSLNPAGSKALDGVSPNDPGVDISSFGSASIWKKLAGN